MKGKSMRCTLLLNRHASQKKINTNAMIKQFLLLLARKLSTTLPYPNPIAARLLSTASNELNATFSQLDTSDVNVLDRDKLCSIFSSPLPKVFHILCSGESLPKTMPLIRDNEGTVALNLSGIIGSNFTFYFIETFGEKEPEFKRIQAAVLNSVNPKYVIAKNIDEGLIDLVELGRFLSPNKLYCTRDAQSPFGFYPSLKSSVENFSRALYDSDRKFFLRSIQSTTLILDFLSLLGIQKIILHGFDGYGSHYYATPEFVTPKFLKTEELTADMTAIKLMSNSTEREVRTSQIRHMQALLPCIISRLQDRGTSLYLAQKIGAYCNIIPHYWE